MNNGISRSAPPTAATALRWEAPLNLGCTINPQDVGGGGVQPPSGGRCDPRGAKMIEIAGQDDASGSSQLEIQNLMSRRVPRRGLDDHRSVTKNIMFVVFDD